MRRELTITGLGSRGDGVAESDGGPVYVPFALPGERIVADVDGNRGDIIDIAQPSPDRRTPLCRHFGTCGGCAMQHLANAPYLDWKQQRVASALRMENIDAPIEPPRAFGA